MMALVIAPNDGEKRTPQPEKSKDQLKAQIRHSGSEFGDFL